jgi:hypothetical protein
MMASSCAPRCANDPEIRAAAPAHIMFFFGVMFRRFGGGHRNVKTSMTF